ncbi:MAG: ferritin-like domain-containing protein [Alphaproteobacteria bacterium]|nr:ferritin-like domain-containing protein [Alphaproteobacteria bacterium]
MASQKSLNDLTLNFLRDIYYAERQILKALPKMAKAAESDQLKQAFQHHREETEHQVERLQQVFEKLGTRARGQTCEAINGIIEEGEEIVSEFEKGPVLDAALAANAQAVEHYEMSRYGTLVAWAKAAGQNEIVQLLEQTLEEEKKADTLLNQLANKELNQKALEKRAA